MATFSTLLNTLVDVWHSPLAQSPCNLNKGVAAHATTVSQHPTTDGPNSKLPSTAQKQTTHLQQGCNAWPEVAPEQHHRQVWQQGNGARTTHGRQPERSTAYAQER